MCDIGKKPTKKRTTKAPVEKAAHPEPVAPAAPEKKPSLLEAMKRAVVAEASPPPPQRREAGTPRVLAVPADSGLLHVSMSPEKKLTVPPKSEATLVFEAAVRALAPILCDDDKERFRAVIASVPSPKERAIIWRARRKAEAANG